MFYRILPLVSFLSTLAFSPFSDANANPAFSTQPCPDSFKSVPIIENARLCQPFADSLPASMIYHADITKDEAVAFYEQHIGTADSKKHMKGRVMLTYTEKQVIIVISKDGQGSQVDILVKSVPIDTQKIEH